MVTRKLSLEEWFTNYQLSKIKANAFHLPFLLKIDISAFWNQDHQKNPSLNPSLNALIIKALGRTAHAMPEMNRIFFPGLSLIRGPRYLEMNEIRLNVPIEIHNNDKKIITAIVIRDAHKKSLSEISLELKSAKKKSLGEYPITKFVHTHRNIFFNRWRLKALYFFLMNIPQLYHKWGGGGVSYSSLSLVQNSHFTLWPMAFGPNGFSFCYHSVEGIGSQTHLLIGVGYNHYCQTGAQATRILNRFCDELLAEGKSFSNPKT